MERPDLKIDYVLSEELKSIKWTYGLSSDIQRIIPTIGDALSAFTTSPDIREYVLRRCLTEKKGFVKDENELIDPEAIDDLDPDEVLKILEWVQGHLMYFFGRSAESTHHRATEFKEVLAQLNPSTNGSKDSPSETPPVGPSE